MIRRPPRSTLDRSSAASDVYKRQVFLLTSLISFARFTDLQNGVLVTIEPNVVHEIRATPKAVSYTHLRAHETVLDLVCRLLLEKKKQT